MLGSDATQRPDQAVGQRSVLHVASTVMILAGVSLGCHADLSTGNSPNDSAIDSPDSAVFVAAEVREMARRNGYNERRRRNRAQPALVELGRALVFDKELSGNRQVSCMTCHLPGLATGDGKSLSVGVGGEGLGADRSHPDNVFIPRNAPSLLNLDELATTLFWDGRISSRNGELSTPAGDQITPEMESVFRFSALSAQPMFPVLSREEMRGESGNELADIPDDDMQGIWEALMNRLGAFDEYRTMFEAAYPGTPFDDMTFAHASNAMAGFFVSELAFDESRWDRFWRGGRGAMTLNQLRGARSFFREGCASCHRGGQFTDRNFHNTGLAQIGPGQGDGPSGRDDFGHNRVSGAPEDLWAFRTAPLRNVELTGPFGHAGQFIALEDFVEHYDEPDQSIFQYDPNQLEPALQGTLLGNQEAILTTLDRRLENSRFSPEAAARITAFLLTLTDDAARDLSGIVPARVPSGLPIDGR